MLTLKDTAGKLIQCPTGFSWTALFFGPFVPLFRGWLPMIPIYLGGTFLTFGVFALVMPFQLNRYWVAFLMDRGCLPATPADAQAVAALGLPDASLPSWTGRAIHAYRTGEVAPYGLYVALNKLDYRFVNDDNTPLEGAPGVEYLRLPMLLALAMLPCLAIVFYLAFPVMVIGMALLAFFFLVVKPVRALAVRNAHLAEMNWNPVMAHMKRPDDKDGVAPTSHDSQETKKPDSENEGGSDR